MELRPYQVQAVELLRKSMAAGNKRVVLCLPTGSGKSVIFSELVRLSAIKATECLILTHRVELFTSTFAHLERSGITPELILPGKKNPPPDSLITVAMVETLQRRINKGLSLSPKLIIIDEAHFGNFSKIIELFPDAFIIGVTATPIGKHFHRFYQDIVANIDIPELVDIGFLMPCRAYELQDDFSDVAVNSMGEFDNNALYTHFNKKSLYDGVVFEYRRLALGKKTLVFNVNIEHTISMTQAFRDDGFDARYITSKTPMDERKETLAAFKRGDFTILNNCGILTTGYDEPSIECIIMNRATLSLPLWLQCQGRGSRPSPYKLEFLVIDFGKNHERHGMWQSERVWSLDPPKKKKKLDASPIKTCPKCRFVMAANSRECPECGHEFPVPKGELLDGVAVLVSDGGSLKGRKLSSLSIEEIAILQNTKRFKPTYLWRVIRSRGKEAISQYATLKKYKRYWVKQQILKLSDSNFYDSTI